MLKMAKKCSLKFNEQINKIGKRIEKEFKGKKRKKKILTASSFGLSSF